MNKKVVHCEGHSYLSAAGWLEFESSLSRSMDGKKTVMFPGSTVSAVLLRTGIVIVP